MCSSRIKTTKNFFPLLFHAMGEYSGLFEFPSKISGKLFPNVCENSVNIVPILFD
jgi:hypothetical protein